MKMRRKEFLQMLVAAAASAAWPPRQGRAATADMEAALVTNDAVGRIPIIFRKVRPLDDPNSDYPGFHPAKTMLQKGYVRRKGGLPLPCDIIFERDVAVKLRDGVVIYTDVYRPPGSGKVPAIVCWSPYGKHGRDPGIGVPWNSVSGLEKWEGLDPAYWCNHGYAIINPDARGAFSSEGDTHAFGTFEGKDGRDFIEWVAAQEWSSGKVGMAGNSWLCIAQWFIAAEQPPHLAAFCPWEGIDDIYRDSLGRGGIPDNAFFNMIVGRMQGKNRAEDLGAMIEKYPLMNEYWEDKIARVEKIQIPAYVTASWTNALHAHGTLNAFQHLGSRDKWLRVHNTHEWHDLYTPENTEDQRRFFDRYLKGLKNGWESTPRIRLAVLDPGGFDFLNRPEKEFPLARTQYTKLYLDPRSDSFSLSPIPEESAKRYRADDGAGEIFFTHRFDRITELTGYLKLHLWVEAEGANDMDLFVHVQKLDADGKVKDLEFAGVNRAYSGPDGRLRVSHRQVDRARSSPWEPYLTYSATEPLSPGQIMSVEIPIWPTGMLWRAGEQLRLKIAGYGKALGPDVPVKTINKGEHVIHAGGRYDSYLQVPVIPG